MIEQLAALLHTGLGVTIGVDLTIGPAGADAPPACTTLLELPSTPAPLQLDQTEHQIEIITRAPTYAAARDEAWRVFTFLRRKGSFEIGTGDDTLLVQSSRAASVPHGSGMDEANNFMLSSTFLFQVKT